MVDGWYMGSSGITGGALWWGCGVGWGGLLNWDWIGMEEKMRSRETAIGAAAFFRRRSPA